MIYRQPLPGEALTQGDIFDDCPLLDLRHLHTVPRMVLERLIRERKRVVSIGTPFREHLAQHFAVTYSRIGLPIPYETQAES